MKEMNLSDVKFMVSSALNRAICRAKSNLASAWIGGVITEQQLDAGVDQLDNALALAKVAINNAESNQEIDEVTRELEQHLRNYAKRSGLPCKF
jgi:hypothetical protein